MFVSSRIVSVTILYLHKSILEINVRAKLQITNGSPSRILIEFYREAIEIARDAHSLRRDSTRKRRCTYSNSRGEKNAHITRKEKRQSMCSYVQKNTLRTYIFVRRKLKKKKKKDGIK